MQTLSKNAKKFDKILVKDHAKNTLSPETIEKLDIMIKPLLKVINESAKMVDFWAVGYESLKEYQVKNLRYKIYEVDCFLYDRLNWTEIRVLLQLIEDPTDSAVGKFNCRFETSPDKKNVAEETTPEFPTYPIGYPSNEQLIPLPSQVIITEKMVLDMDGISFHLAPENFQSERGKYKGKDWFHTDQSYLTHFGICIQGFWNLEERFRNKIRLKLKI